MSLASTLATVFNPLRTLWDSREPRERRLVSLAGAVLLAGGVYAWVLDPALQGTQTLTTSLPAAQAQAAQVQQLAAQLKAKPAAGGDAQSATALQASLTAAGIVGKVDAKAQSNSAATVTLSAAPGATLWDWLGSHAVSRSQLKRNADGSWRGELTLEP